MRMAQHSPPDPVLNYNEKSKALKRRLRRERVAMEKAGDFVPFHLRVVKQESTQIMPKLTNSAKRAARKRKKRTIEQNEMDLICAPAIEEEKCSSSKQSRPVNKRIKLSNCNDETLFCETEEPVSLPNKQTFLQSTGIQMEKDVAIDESNDQAEPISGDKEAKNIQPAKKKRYVLFVGNLSYETVEEDVMQHFKKAGSIKSVRLAKHKENNKCRGFCHLEVGDEETYLKALSLHHTIMAKRRINVEYSSGQTEEKGEVKRKAFKLQTLNKTGKLQGGKQQGHGKSKKQKVTGKPSEFTKGEFFV